MENSSPNLSFSICDIQIQKQISRSFGKSFPQKIVLPKLRPHCSATCPNTWRAEPRKKNTLSFFKRNFTPPNQKCKECFSFGVAETLRGSGGMVHSSSGLVSKYIRTLSNKHRQKMKSGSEAKIWSARSAVCSEFPQKIPKSERVRHAPRGSSFANTKL